ncbi:hypothetical protein GCM10025857_07260 [Alicyclobacillus contaminans]|nr:hypothetical protein GCM10025857_07260 [Alicyclobacillus contaminans]
MHAKATTWYICHRYVSTGRSMYYKREMLTTDSYRDLRSVYWSAPKPITRNTFERARKLGYKCDVVWHYDPPAQVIPFDPEKKVTQRGTKRSYRTYQGGRESSAFARFLLRWRV